MVSPSDFDATQMSAFHVRIIPVRIVLVANTPPSSDDLKNRPFHRRPGNFAAGRPGPSCLRVLINSDHTAGLSCFKGPVTSATFTLANSKPSAVPVISRTPKDLLSFTWAVSCCLLSWNQTNIRVIISCIYIYIFYIYISWILPKTLQESVVSWRFLGFMI